MFKAFKFTKKHEALKIKDWKTKIYENNLNNWKVLHSKQWTLKIKKKLDQQNEKWQFEKVKR